MKIRTYKIAGATLLIMGIAVSFVAAGHMDGGSSWEILLVLVLAAVSLLISGLALLKAAEEIEWLEGIRIKLNEFINKEYGETPIDYSIRERKSECQ
jgi:hypothetical protein